MDHMKQHAADLPMRGSGTQSLTTSSESSGHGDPEHRMQPNMPPGGKVLITGSLNIDSIKARVPSTIPCHSINGTFKGTFHLHEYLSSTSTSSSYSRLRACVTQDGTPGRMTPREAEMRAGKGSRKSWKLTLMTMHAGQEMSLQKYFTLLGVERPGQDAPMRPEAVNTVAAEPSEGPANRASWGSSARDHWCDEPNSKRQHVQGREDPRRTTDESGSSAWQVHSPASLATLSRSSAQDVLLSTRPSVHSAGGRSLDLPDSLMHRPSLQFTTFAYPVSRSAPTLSVDTSPSLIASLAAASNIQRTSAPAGPTAEGMESLLRKFELNRRLSATASAYGAGQQHQMASSSSLPTSQDWPQSALVNATSAAGLLHSQARNMLTAHAPSYLASASGVHQLLPVNSQPVTAFLLQQGVTLSTIGPQTSITALPRATPFQNSSGLFHISTDLGSQSLGMPTVVHTIPRLSDNSGHRMADRATHHLVFQQPSLATRLSDTLPPSVFSEQQGIPPRLSGTGSLAMRRALTSPGEAVGRSETTFAPGPMTGRNAAEASEPMPMVTDRPDLSALPTTIPIFTPNNEVTGTLHLHEYVTGTISRPNRPPACVMLPGNDTPVTPRVAEAKAGREARKNWKESFRTTLPDGRVISLKSFFAMHNIN